MDININNLIYDYQDSDVQFRALNRINLSIKQGEFLAIVGASGSGKSTLLNVIGLLSSPTEGTYRLAEQEINGLSEEELAGIRSKKIGFVFQQFNLLAKFNAIENVILPSIYSDNINFNKRKAFLNRAINLFKELGISDKISSFPNELSGGQKQRIAICRALLMDPEIILADEPTGALDGITTKEVLDILLELNSRGKTVIIITHDPEVAALASRKIVLKDGEIEQDIVIKNEKICFLNEDKITESTSIYNNLISNIYRLYINISHAIKTLSGHSLRSFLTGLGLLIGVISIIFIFGLGIVAERAFTAMFMRPATQLIYIFVDRHGPAGRNNKYWSGLNTSKEFPAFAEKFAEYGTIRPMYGSDTCNLSTSGGVYRSRIKGVYDMGDFLNIDASLHSGRYPTEFEISAGTPVMVLGYDATDSLFSANYKGRAKSNFPLGEKVYISNCNILDTYTIIGVFKKQDMLFTGTDANDIVYAPISSLISASGDSNFRNGFSVLPKQGVDSRWLADSITNFLSLKDSGRVSFNSFIPAEMLDKITSMLNIIQYLTGFIGVLCIVVGGIGIMNIMLVSVRERIREIGLLKSLGAKPKHIFMQFIVECTTLCSISGLIGILVGIFFNNLIAFISTKFFPVLGEFQFVVASEGIVFAIIVTVVCGFAFGLFPSLQAMRVNPAECLRDE